MTPGLLKGRRSARWWREAWEGYLFAAPWLLGFFLFVLGPMVVSILMSFTRWDGITPVQRIEWVGLVNYRELLGDDPRFVKALQNTAWYVLFAVPLGTLNALSLALLLVLMLAMASVGGALMPAWMDIIGRAIPTTLRGRFFGAASLLASIGGLLAGAATTYLLAALPEPQSYGFCFLAG